MIFAIQILLIAVGVFLVCRFQKLLGFPTWIVIIISATGCAMGMGIAAYDGRDKIHLHIFATLVGWIIGLTALINWKHIIEYAFFWRKTAK
jgi:hypothetical protein